MKSLNTSLTKTH